MSVTNRSDLEFDVVCIATLPGLTLLVGAIGLALLQVTSQEIRFSSKSTYKEQTFL